jgi:nucleotide sugar dehydrogenase
VTPRLAPNHEFLAAVRAGQVEVAIWGCGHIGASALFHLAVAGVRCFGYDVAMERIQAIQDGRFLSTEVVHPAPPSATPDTAVAPLRVSVSSDWHEMASHPIGIHLICVPTDRGPEPSSEALADVVEHAAQVIRDAGPLRIGGRTLPRLLVVESTIVPSWIHDIVLPAIERAGLELNRDVAVGAAPRRDWFSGVEFSLRTLPRIMGASSPEAAAMMAAFYSLVCSTIHIARDAEHAALTKVVENAIRYHDISFANDLAVSLPDYDVAHVLDLAATKWNIQRYHPSLGIGGHCIPLAPRYLLAEAREPDRFQLVRETVDFNASYFERLYASSLNRLLADAHRIAVLGMAYTPDARMEKLSPAYSVVAEMTRQGRTVHVHDPYYSAAEIKQLAGVDTFAFPDDLSTYDAVVLVTAHTPYLEAPAERYIRPGAVVVDNFGNWRNRTFAADVKYHEIGTPA